MIEAKLDFNEIDLAKIEHLTHWLRLYSGQLSGTVTMRQPNRQGAASVVIGSVRLAQARFEDAPFFQPVVSRLEAAGLQGPSTLDLQFRAAAEKVTIDMFMLRSAGHSLNLSGSIGLLGGLIDLSGTVDEEALLAHVTGTIESPDWQLVGPQK
jgi:hypothetical protein